jgi:hypothetical protein
MQKIRLRFVFWFKLNITARIKYSKIIVIFCLQMLDQTRYVKINIYGNIITAFST